MALKQFSPIKTTDQDLNLIQEAIREPLNTLIKNPLNGVKWMANISLKAGNNLVVHGLGRNYLSFWIGNQTAASSITAGTSPDPSKYLMLGATASCKADIFVF
jgi:hypothetical protein